MLLKVFALALLSLGYVNAKTNCDTLNKSFGTKSGLFMECVLENNEKATFCLNCALDYSIFLTSYNAFINGHDAEPKNTSCRSRFVDINQIDIVEGIYADTKRLWDSGFCSGEIID